MSKPAPIKPPATPKPGRGPVDNRPPTKPPAKPPKSAMTPADWGRAIASSWPPITQAQADTAARILAGWHTTRTVGAQP